MPNAQLDQYVDEIAYYLASSSRNLVTGRDHAVSGDDNLVSGQENAVLGSISQAHGQTGTVQGTRSVLFSLDGDSHVLAADNTLEIWADSVTVNGNDISSGSGGITELTGDVTAGPGSGSQAATIPNDTVTYAKMQNVSAASKLIGRGSAGGSGDPQEITIGTGLSMSGTTISASGSGGDVVGPASSVDAEIVLFDSTTGKLIKRATGTGFVRAASGVYSAAKLKRLLACVIGDGTNVIATGVAGFQSSLVAGTITNVRVLSSDAAVTSGSIVIDIWKDTYTNYPPTVADTITASAKPTISSATKAEDSTLTGWTTSVSAGDVFGFNVDSVSSLKRVTLELTIEE